MLERISSGFGRRRGWQISSAVEVVCLEESPPAMTTGSRDSEVLRGIGETNQSTVKTWRSSSNRVVKQAFQFRQQAVEQPVSGEACSVEDVEEFEKSVESSKLLAACKNVDPVKECCEQVCQDAISEAAAKIAGESVEVSALDAASPLPRNSTKIGLYHIGVSYLVQLSLLATTIIGLFL
ncbi:Uncharacterized GPI-anchored protein At1g61900 [Linum perenne]